LRSKERAFNFVDNHTRERQRVADERSREMHRGERRRHRRERERERGAKERRRRRKSSVKKRHMDGLLWVEYPRFFKKLTHNLPRLIRIFEKITQIRFFIRESGLGGF
jgi:hypothetical protein